ncbi:disheveled-associated activator of morphogenesis 1 isoform X2, partial [Aphis craccivora]
TVPRSMAGLAERLSGMMPTPSVRGRKGWCGCLKLSALLKQYSL